MEPKKLSPLWKKIGLVLATLTALICLATVSASAANFSSYVYRDAATGKWVSTKNSNEAVNKGDNVIAYSKSANRGKWLASTPDVLDEENGKYASLHRENNKLYVQLCEDQDSCENGAIELDKTDVAPKTTINVTNTVKIPKRDLELNVDNSVDTLDLGAAVATIVNHLPHRRLLAVLPETLPIPFTTLTIPTKLALTAAVVTTGAALTASAVGIPLALGAGALAVGVPAVTIGVPLALGAGSLAVGVPLTAAVLGAKALAAFTVYKTVSFALIPAKLLAMHLILIANGALKGALIGGALAAGPGFLLILPLALGASLVLAIPEALTLGALTFMIIL